MTSSSAVLVAQLAASAAMCGISWFVQAVHYPLLRDSGGDIRVHAAENRRRTAPVVIPFMLVEGAAAAVVAWAPPAGVPRAAALVGVGLVAAAWLSTALVQMPLHARLAREGHACGAAAALVRTNWARAALWTLRAALAAWMLAVSA